MTIRGKQLFSVWVAGFLAGIALAAASTGHWDVAGGFACLSAVNLWLAWTARRIEKEE